MVITGFKIIKYLLDHALLIDQKTDAMDAIIFFTHKFFGSPDTKSISHLMILITQQCEIELIPGFKFSVFLTHQD